jgi:hypothetical protein
MITDLILCCLHVLTRQSDKNEKGGITNLGMIPDTYGTFPANMAQVGSAAGILASFSSTLYNKLSNHLAIQWFKPFTC